jgi:BirA family transcriptional regulator, biotin operon repressor / biotin---[acetyl-CoA-carboxylase] ligase
MDLDIAAVRARFPGRTIVWLESCASTMIEAARLAASGCESGAIVGAEEQTAGRGRFGRQWHSGRGLGLYASFVFRRDDPGLLPLALGVAAAEAMGPVCDLRWPNDVLIGERKCAGILVEAAPPAFIAGIGINVNQAEFPHEVSSIATSLRLAAGRPQEREGLLVRLIEAVDRWVPAGSAAILRRFSEASSYVRGKRVIVEQGAAAIHGVTDGLDESGYLWLRKDDGSRELILAGGVRPHPAT